MIAVYFIIGVRLKSLRRIYVIAGIISLVLYVAGIATGYYLQGDIFGIVESDIDKVRSDISTVEQEIPLLSLRGEASCNILPTLSTDVNDRLNRILNEIIDLEQNRKTNDAYNKLLNDYTSLAVRGWILDKDIKQSCGDDSVPTLYFFSVPCEDCIEQGKILTELREKYGKGFPVFSLNARADQPAIKILTKSFNITETPSLILDSTPIQGFVSKENLDNIICKKLRAC